MRSGLARKFFVPRLTALFESDLLQIQQGRGGLCQQGRLGQLSRRVRGYQYASRLSLPPLLSAAATALSTCVGSAVYNLVEGSDVQATEARLGRHQKDNHASIAAVAARKVEGLVHELTCTARFVLQLLCAVSGQRSCARSHLCCSLLASSVLRCEQADKLRQKAGLQASSLPAGAPAKAVAEKTDTSYAAQPRAAYVPPICVSWTWRH